MLLDINITHNLLEQGIQFGIKVLAAILIYVVGFYAIRYLSKLLRKIFERRHTEQTLSGFVVSLVSIVLMVLLVITTISTLGVNTTSLAALLTGGSMAIGLILQGTVQNFAGGLMLLVFKPFQVGHYIEAMGVSGTVVEVSIVATKILTYDNRIVVLPNGQLANSTIDNLFAQPLRRVDIEISVAYGTDTEELRKTVMELLSKDERVLHHGSHHPHAGNETAIDQSNREIADPRVWLKSLNANDITFVIWLWTKTENYWPVLFETQEHLYTELPKHGFAFAYPHVDVTMVQP